MERFIKRHAGFKELDAHIRRHYGNEQAKSLSMVSERHFLVRSADDPTRRILVRLVAIWRAGSLRHGPGLLGEPSMSPLALSVFPDLMDALGGCSSILYNEALHHHHLSNASHYRESVGHAMRVLLRTARRNGAHVAVRETAVQHFRTERSGAPASLSSLAGAGSFDLIKNLNLSAISCVQALRAKPHDWHNAILSEAWKQHAGKGSVTPDSVTPGSVTPGSPRPRLVAFHEFSSLWGAVLFPNSTIDCTHTLCYTPFYWAPLWDGWAASLERELAEQHNSDAAGQIQLLNRREPLFVSAADRVRLSSLLAVPLA